MSATASQPSAGRFAGHAVRGTAKLTHDDLRQIEAHRAKDRPTPWPHLAIRYGVNELDLRAMFPTAANDAQPVAPTILAIQHPHSEATFRLLWEASVSKAKIAYAMGMSSASVDRMRRRLSLAPRLPGSKPKDHRHGASA